MTNAQPNRVKHSRAFSELLENRREVIQLLRAVPDPIEQMRSKQRTALANALCRGSVVLLCSHLEGYIESLVVECVDAINANSLQVGLLPMELRIVQMEQPLRSAHEAQNQRKLEAIRNLFSNYAWLGDDRSVTQVLASEPITRKFSNSSPKEIRKLFSFFGIPDVIGSALALDTGPNIGQVERKVAELVDKRNIIAHNAMALIVTPQQLPEYLRASVRFACYLDIAVGQGVQRLTQQWPWI